MAKNVTLFTIVAVGIIGLAGCSHVNNQAQNAVPEKQEAVSEVPNAQAEEASTQKVAAENAQAPAYASFTQERYSEFLGKKPVALFFHASWCSTCVGLTKDIKKELSSFPNGTTILEANFDTETKLKKDYGVAMQATLVVLDKNGKVVQTLAAPSVEKLKTAIAQTL